MIETTDVKEKNTKIFTPCLLYTSAVLLSLIFSAFFKTTKTPVCIVDNVLFSLNELDKKIEKNTMAGIKKHGSAETTSQEEIKQIKSELMSARDKIVKIRMEIKSKSWAN